MNIALIGASGGVGTAVVAEALRRGHRVTAICRHPEHLSQQAGLLFKAVDLFVPGKLLDAIHGHDVVVSCFNLGHVPDPTRNIYKDTLEGVVRIIKAVKTSNIRRLLFVGGAASLYVSPGVQLLDVPGYPFSVMDKMPQAFHQWFASLPIPSFNDDPSVTRPPTDTGGPEYVPAFVRAYLFFEHDMTYDWSFFSPPPAMIPGPRTGRYELGHDEVPMCNDCYGTISYADAAVALIDELENATHTRQHWTAQTVA